MSLEITSSNLIRWSGLVNILTGISLGIWWGISFVFYLLLMIATGPAFEFIDLVLIPGWVPVNIIGLIGSILLPLGLTGLYARQIEESGILGLIGFFLSVTSAMLFMAVQYYETFLWPVVALTAPTIFDFVMVQDLGIFLMLLIMAGMLMVGFIILGVVTIRNGVIPRSRWGAVLLIISGPLFAMGGVLGPLVRTVSIAVFSVCILWLGYALWKDETLT